MFILPKADTEEVLQLVDNNPAHQINSKTFLDGIPGCECLVRAAYKSLSL